MAVSKRLRYEILRRDNHACRYCGATAPDVKLNVDHVIPQALGGGNTPTNLVTSCAACNAGKTSSMPNAMPVADVEQQTFRQAADMKESVERKRRQEKLKGGYRVAAVQAVASAWVGSYMDRFGGDPTETMLFRVRDLTEAGLNVGVKVEQLLDAAIAGGACGESAFGLFMREDPDFLAEVEEAYFVWRHCWLATGVQAPDEFDAGCFRSTVRQAIGLEYTQYQIVQQAARTGEARGIDLVEALASSNVIAAGGEV
jgi:hypothetical protein